MNDKTLNGKEENIKRFYLDQLLVNRCNFFFLCFNCIRIKKTLDFLHYITKNFSSRVSKIQEILFCIEF